MSPVSGGLNWTKLLAGGRPERWWWLEE